MSLNITLEVHKCCEKDNCIIIMFIAFLFCGQYRFVSFFPFVHPLFGPDYVQLFFLDCTLSFFPFYSHVHCPAPLPLFFLSSPHCVPLSPLPSPPPVCDGSFSWRCCSTASVCPACCANPPPHQALGPSTHTKYFYLFIQFHGLPGGNLRLDKS